MTKPLTREQVEKKLHKLLSIGFTPDMEEVFSEDKNKLKACDEIGTSYTALRTKLERMTEKYQGMVAWYDEHYGTPCEQVRHQQTIAKLRAQLAQSLANHRADEQAYESTIDTLLGEKREALEQLAQFILSYADILQVHKGERPDEWVNKEGNWVCDTNELAACVKVQLTQAENQASKCMQELIDANYQLAKVTARNVNLIAYYEEHLLKIFAPKPSWNERDEIIALKNQLAEALTVIQELNEKDKTKGD